MTNMTKKPYDIVLHPDTILKQKAQPVAEFDDALKDQAERMVQTMYEARGIGLAANQVGLLNRVFVLDVDYRGDDEGDEASNKQAKIMVNPEIIEESKTLEPYTEGCLSLPQQYADVIRPAAIKVRYQDVEGKAHEEEIDDLYARCFQHELDHLNGVLFIDHISGLRRNMLIKKLNKFKKDQGIDDNRLIL